MARTLSLQQRLSERTLQMTSLEQLQIMRNLCLGGAAACLVVLGGLLQVSAKTGWEFSVATWATSLSLPMWVMASSLYEAHILLGPRSFAHLLQPRIKATLARLLGMAGFTLWIAVGSVVAILNVHAAVGYLLMSVFMAVVGTKMNQMLAEWWFVEDGPHSVDTGRFE